MKVAGVFHVERRRSERKAAVLRVTFPWHNGDAQGQTLDISESGMRLRADADLGIGLRIVLYLSRGPGTPMQPVEVEIMRSLASGDARVFEFGCRFVELQPGVIEAIRNLTAPQPTEQQSFADPAALDAALAADTENRGKNKQVAEQLLKSSRNLSEQGDLETAVRVLEQGAQRVPDSADILEELAQMMFQQGRVSESASLFDKALRIRQEQA